MTLPQVKIFRIDKDLPLPSYATEGSVGFDLLARERVEVPSSGISLIPANVIIEVPQGYMLAIASRSSTPKKKGFLTPHGFGVIDQDYCGGEDEIKIQVYNFSGESVVVERGERLAQGLFVRVDTLKFQEVNQVEAANRGGFGSTGS